MNIQGSEVWAASGDGVTIADVVEMESWQRVKYIHNTASLRGLEIGKIHGDAVLKCLSREFHGIKKKPDGNHEFPRGLNAAILLVHRANNNGKASELASGAISGVVDLVAERVCGVKS